MRKDRSLFWKFSRSNCGLTAFLTLYLSACSAQTMEVSPGAAVRYGKPSSQSNPPQPAPVEYAPSESKAGPNPSAVDKNSDLQALPGSGSKPLPAQPSDTNAPTF